MGLFRPITFLMAHPYFQEIETCNQVYDVTVYPCLADIEIIFIYLEIGTSLLGHWFSNHFFKLNEDLFHLNNHAERLTR